MMQGAAYCPHLKRQFLFLLQKLFLRKQGAAATAT